MNQCMSCPAQEQTGAGQVSLSHMQDCSGEELRKWELTAPPLDPTAVPPSDPGALSSHPQSWQHTQPSRCCARTRGAGHSCFRGKQKILLLLESPFGEQQAFSADWPGRLQTPDVHLCPSRRPGEAQSEDNLFQASSLPTQEPHLIPGPAEPASCLLIWRLSEELQQNGWEEAEPKGRATRQDDIGGLEPGKIRVQEVEIHQYGAEEQTRGSSGTKG